MIESTQDFLDYYNRVLIYQLRQFEVIRKKYLLQNIRIVTILFALFLFFYLTALMKTWEWLYLIESIAIVVFFLTMLPIMSGRNLSYRNKYISSVVPMVLKEIDKSAFFDLFSQIKREYFNKSRISSFSNHYTGSNCISFIVNDAAVTFAKFYCDDEGFFGSRYPLVSSFSGYFLFTDIKKNTDCNFVIFSRYQSKPDLTGYKKVEYGNTKFSENFLVYANNEKKVKTILTLDFINKLVEFSNKYGWIRISHVDGIIYLVFPILTDSLSGIGLLSPAINIDPLKYFVQDVLIILYFIKDVLPFMDFEGDYFDGSVPDLSNPFDALKMDYDAWRVKLNNLRTTAGCVINAASDQGLPPDTKRKRADLLKEQRHLIGRAANLEIKPSFDKDGWLTG